MTRALLLAALGLIVGCGGDGPVACVPGQSSACTCASGATGAQVCRSDGTFGSCDCSGTQANGGSGGSGGGATVGNGNGGSGGSGGGGNGNGGSGGSGGGGGGSGGNGGGGGSGGSGGGMTIQCSQPSSSQCDCSFQAPGDVPATSSCKPSQFSPGGLCCATMSWPSTSNSACFCEAYGCSRNGSCLCVLGGGPDSKCTVMPGEICCQNDSEPSCICATGTSCMTGTHQVSGCDVSSATCDGYAWPQTVSSCN